MRSHRLPEFDVDVVYAVVRDNLLYFITTLLQSWGDCIDKVLYDIAKKRTRLAKVASFFARCDEDYIARAIYVLDKYIPTQTKQLFLDALFNNYVSTLRPWIIRELKKKRPRSKEPRASPKDKQAREHILLAISFLVDALTPLFRYKDTCIAAEVHDILIVSKRMELMFLKRVKSKAVYTILSAKIPLLATVAQHNKAVDNIRYATCRSEDRHIKEFALEVVNVVVKDPIRLQRHLIVAIGRI